MAPQTTSTDTIEYYQRRAPHYDDVYGRPERQQDLRQLDATVPEFFLGRDVLEIAAGTGYWTQRIAEAASSVLATDYSAEPLAEAARRTYPHDNVEFRRLDAYDLNQLSSRHSAAFAGFWWSHMRIDAIDGFLTDLTARLEPESPIVFIDNRYVEGSSTPISREDQHGNTYQDRTLPDGTSYEVLKNFPEPAVLEDTGSRFGTGVRVVEQQWYWMLTFTTRERGNLADSTTSANL
ncbi:class I SAM-dependent methyltransferase [Dactylosporangium sp. NPDC051541]|uniref:class I SAM-dependent methyltransferase n=1 Tax=Dactylosporangium sp. NPDC051541 TaxID=3363977 RepID=UPI00379D9EDB